MRTKQDRIRANESEMLFLRQAIQAQAIRESLAEPTEARIRTLEASNANCRAILAENTAELETVDRVVTTRKPENGERQYRNAYDRALSRAKNKNVEREHEHRQEYRHWWYDQPNP